MNRENKPTATGRHTVEKMVERVESQGAALSRWRMWMIKANDLIRDSNPELYYKLCKEDDEIFQSIRDELQEKQKAQISRSQLADIAYLVLNYRMRDAIPKLAKLNIEVTNE